MHTSRGIDERGGRRRLVNPRSLVASFAILLVASLLNAGLGMRVVHAEESNWPQFRGAFSQGVANNPDLPDSWSATENILWMHDVAGRGWSSPIVWGQRVFITSVASDEDLAGTDLKRGIYFGGDRHEPSKAVHRWRVVCLDLADGHVLWEQIAHQGLPPQSAHLKNTYASETPVTDGERVYAYFGNLGVFCYTIEGEPLWSRTLGAYKTADGMGTGGSPIAHQDRVYILNDNEEQSFLLSLDKKTGAEIWRTLRPERSSWSTPYIWASDKRTEIVISGSETVRSYDLDGKPLWHLGGMTMHSIPTPVAGPELLYVASGHVLGAKRPIVAIRPGAGGDITLGDEQTSNDFVAWSLLKASPYNTSILFYREYIYVLTDLGILYCYDAHTGRALYEKKRLPNGRAFTASPWAYNGQVFCLSEYGETFVIKAGPEFKLLRVNALGEDEIYMATPAIAGNTLLVRSDRGIYAIQKSKRDGREPNRSP
jgi:outer membrane protein assembly factor BamB